MEALPLHLFEDVKDVRFERFTYLFEKS